MRIIEKKIYNFDELNESVKEELIEDRKKSDYDCYMENFFQDDMEHNAEELVDDYFGSDADFIQTYYSLSYCQGDGAMIEFDVNIVDLNNKYKIFSDEEIGFLTDKGIINNIEVRHNNNHYYHEYKFGINFNYYDMGYTSDDVIDEGYKITNNEFNTLEDRLYKLLDDSNKHYTTSPFITDVINMNKELVKRGYSIVENYDFDTTYIVEELRNNEYYEDGGVYYG